MRYSMNYKLLNDTKILIWRAFFLVYEFLAILLGTM